MDMAAVNALVVQGYNSLLSNSYVNQKRYYLSDNDEAQPFNECRLKQLDYMSMRRQNICLDLNTIY